jgi:hypothetical protein
LKSGIFTELLLLSLIVLRRVSLRSNVGVALVFVSRRGREEEGKRGGRGNRDGRGEEGEGEILIVYLGEVVVLLALSLWETPDTGLEVIYFLA